MPPGAAPWRPEPTAQDASPSLSPRNPPAGRTAAARRRLSDPMSGGGRPQPEARAGHKRAIRSKSWANNCRGTATKSCLAMPLTTVSAGGIDREATRLPVAALLPIPKSTSNPGQLARRLGGAPTLTYRPRWGQGQMEKKHMLSVGHKVAAVDARGNEICRGTIQAVHLAINAARALGMAMTRRPAPSERGPIREFMVCDVWFPEYSVVCLECGGAVKCGQCGASDDLLQREGSGSL
jgi:hypothetical protein